MSHTIRIKQQNSVRSVQSHLNSGFTLIELLVTTTIIIILTTLGIVSYRKAMQVSRNGRRKSDLETVRQSLMLYKSENGYFPDVTGTFSSGVVPTLSSAGYLSQSDANNLQDPKENDANYVYNYTPAGSVVGSGYTDFELEAKLEPNLTPYYVQSP